jgi:hypothetical protein
MRTLGPRSVSSFLKVILDITFLITGAFLAFFGGLALINAFGLATGASLPDWKWPIGWHWALFASTPRAVALLSWITLNHIGALVIVGRLRKVFGTLTKDTPFQFENARRLRVIGLVMAALQVSEWVIWAIVGRNATETIEFLRPDINPVAIFGIVVMFVLAEVFDEGARMKKDLELTI